MRERDSGESTHEVVPLREAIEAARARTCGRGGGAEVGAGVAAAAVAAAAVEGEALLFYSRWWSSR